MALACRYLADEKHSRGLAGQISLKLSDGTFWTNRFDTGFGDVSASKLIRINDAMEVVEGEGMPNPATRFHMWVYAKRPDVRSIVHTHPPHASVLAMTGQPLSVALMDTMMFYDDVALLGNWPGVPVGNEEGELISEAIGQKNAIILVNHGIMTVGQTLEEAVYRAVNLEYAAEMQLAANASGHPVREVTEALARDAQKFTTAKRFVDATFDYWCRLAARSHPDALV
jgi:L-fuculose-phosphate aldolase